MVSEVIGDMEVIEEIGRPKGKTNFIVKVKCSKCGRIKEIPYWNLSKKGAGSKHKWCCKQIKGKYTKNFHRKWADMRTRTTNPKRNDFYLYGGRGINSDAWEYFIDFYDDMYESYLEHVKEFGEKDTSLDRIDVNGNYCKENCRWVTLKEQAGNKRTNRYFKAISPEGEEFIDNNQRKFANEHNLTPQGINNCLSNLSKHCNGWTFEYIKQKEGNKNG